MPGAVPLLPTSSIVGEDHSQNTCSTLTRGANHQASPSSSCFSSRRFSNHQRITSTSPSKPLTPLLPFLFPSNSLLVSIGLQIAAPCNLNPSSSHFVIGLDQKFRQDSHHEEAFGFDESSQPLSFPDEIDNNDNKIIVSASLRPARPDEALRFLGAIEVGS
ncbi:hypothetical protein KY284_028861 [Solanum tuberosum]|uniref:Uncharacterized protein n=1 Tax=Solanum tuberosum TaxID=4113 RepID=M1DUL8_SOLTU|nr:hypothetical protein KY284_028861 [Solanum tuberosum]